MQSYCKVVCSVRPVRDLSRQQLTEGRIGAVSVNHCFNHHPYEVIDSVIYELGSSKSDFCGSPIGSDDSASREQPVYALATGNGTGAVAGACHIAHHCRSASRLSPPSVPEISK